MYTAYVMFHYVTPWFYQDFKSENLCVLNIGPVTRDNVKSFQMRNETPLQHYMLYLHAETDIIFLIFRSKLHKYF